VRLLLVPLILAFGCGGSSAPVAEPAAGDWDVEVPEAMRRDGSAETRAEAGPAPRDQVWTPPSAREAQRPQRAVYRGKRIDLDLKDADLHNVFRLLGDVGGVNIVVSDDVRGAVTLKLRRVPWDQAFDAIVRLEGLAVTRDGNLYLVMPR
jgi:type IV pilus assembly protein PilQ